MASASAWPRISVITPSFNQGRFLRRTLESVHSQGYPDLEHIVIDGGSTDESPAILAEYDSRLAFWVSEKDDGQTDAIARGFSRATGEIFCWLNSDDLFAPLALRQVAEAFNEKPELQFLYGDSRWIDENGTVIKAKREQAFSRFVICWDHNFIPQPSTLFHLKRTLSEMRFYGEQKNTRLRDQSLEEMRRLRERYYPGVAGRGGTLRNGLARAWRVASKAAAGGYSLSELRGSGLFGGKSWEERQLDR
jgi:glycosyltransferase involved in cell wall biosynthesis